MRSSSLAFPVGVFWGVFEEKNRKIHINPEAGKAICSALAVTYLYLLYLKCDTSPYIYAGFIILLFWILQEYKVKSTLLLFLGTISYEIYLWELKLIYFYVIRKYGYLGYFVILLGVSALTHYGYKFVKEKVCSLCSKNKE